MKKRLTIIQLVILLCFVVSPCASITPAQTEEQKAHLYFVEEVVVKPSMVDKYEENTKEALNLWIRYGSPFPFYAFVTDDFHYYIVWPIENYASLDSLFKTIGEWVVKMGDENWQALRESGEGTYEYMKWSMIRHKPELSYSPTNPSLKPDEGNFMYLNFFYIQSGKEEEFEEALKEGVVFYKSINFPFGFDIYAGDMGTEMPMYIYFSKGGSAADFFAQHDRAFKLHTEEAIKLRQKTFITIRKTKVKTGMFRPDLSYIPKEK